jgi:ribosomal 50S subunit-recycling heat shock protein
MRLDLFLKTRRLVARRTLAQEFCEAGIVQVNGAAARSSKEIRAGDEIEIRRRGRKTVIHVQNIPGSKQVSREAARSLYTIVSEEPVVDDH